MCFLPKKTTSTPMISAMATKSTIVKAPYGKVLHTATPRTVAELEKAVASGAYRRFSEPQRGACRRIIHDARHELPKKYPYPSLTKLYQAELLRLDRLMTHFDII